jgi:hypothetical protein
MPDINKEVDMDPIGLLVMGVFIILVAVAAIVPGIQRKREEQ